MRRLCVFRDIGGIGIFSELFWGFFNQLVSADKSCLVGLRVSIVYVNVEMGSCLCWREPYVVMVSLLLK
jgi:hypothetical protein